MSCAAGVRSPPTGGERDGQRDAARGCARVRQGERGAALAAAHGHGQVRRHAEGRRQPSSAVLRRYRGPAPLPPMGAGARIPVLHGRHRQHLRASARHRCGRAAGHERLPYRQPADRRPLRRHLRGARRLRGARSDGRSRDHHPPPDRGHGVDERGGIAVPTRVHGLGRLHQAGAAGDPARCPGRGRNERPRGDAGAQTGDPRCRAPRAQHAGACVRRGPHRAGPGARGYGQYHRRGHRHPGHPAVPRRDRGRERACGDHAPGAAQGRPLGGRRHGEGAGGAVPRRPGGHHPLHHRALRGLPQRARGRARPRLLQYRFPPALRGGDRAPRQPGGRDLPGPTPRGATSR